VSERAPRSGGAASPGPRVSTGRCVCGCRRQAGYGPTARCACKSSPRPAPSAPVPDPSAWSDTARPELAGPRCVGGTAPAARGQREDPWRGPATTRRRSPTSRSRRRRTERLTGFEPWARCVRHACGSRKTRTAETGTSASWGSRVSPEHRPRFGSARRSRPLKPSKRLLLPGARRDPAEASALHRVAEGRLDTRSRRRLVTGSRRRPRSGAADGGAGRAPAPGGTGPGRCARRRRGW